MSVLYPDVPNVPGVPPVLRDASLPPEQDQSLLTQDGGDLQSDQAPTWGLFDDDGAQILQPDSVVALEYVKEEQVSNFPVEQGGFQSFNKVETPYQVHLTMTKSGTVDERSGFLGDCSAARASTNLYTVLTPEAEYQNANVTRVALARNAQSGVQMITVEMVIEEVRQSATSQFTQASTKSPASADAVNTGDVQVVALSGHPIPPQPK